jgi:ATP phosphoribosyltransferase regulatory subunit HisZ
MSKKVDTKNDKNQDDMEDFTKQLNMLEKDTNIMSQLPSYNIKDTDYFINNLENELDQQKTLQMILENKDFDKQLKNIKTFIDNNSDKIDKQLENLKNLSGNIQNIVLENEKLQEDKADLKEILNSQQYKDIANKMREIKMEKEKIRNFLREKGIISLL